MARYSKPGTAVNGSYGFYCYIIVYEFYIYCIPLFCNFEPLRELWKWKYRKAEEDEQQQQQLVLAFLEDSPLPVCANPQSSSLKLFLLPSRLIWDLLSKI